MNKFKLLLEGMTISRAKDILGYVAETPELLDFFMSIKKDIKNKNSKGIIDKIAKTNLPKV